MRGHGGLLQLLLALVPRGAKAQQLALGDSRGAGLCCLGSTAGSRLHFKRNRSTLQLPTHGGEAPIREHTLKNTPTPS